MTVGQKSERNEGMSHVDIKGKRFPGKGNGDVKPRDRSWVVSCRNCKVVGRLFGCSGWSEGKRNNYKVVFEREREREKRKGLYTCSPWSVLGAEELEGLSWRIREGLARKCSVWDWDCGEISICNDKRAFDVALGVEGLESRMGVVSWGEVGGQGVKSLEYWMSHPHGFWNFSKLWQG